MSFAIYPLSPDAAAQHASEWQPVLQPAIDDTEGRWTWRQCFADVLLGHTIIWVILERESQKLVGVSTVRLFHGGKVPWLLIEDLAGERFDEWFEQAYAEFENWARQAGYKQIVIEGRSGWAKKMGKLGFLPTRVQCVKKLEGAT